MFVPDVWQKRYSHLLVLMLLSLPILYLFKVQSKLFN